MESGIQSIYTYQEKDGVAINMRQNSLLGKNITRDRDHYIIMRIISQFPSLKVFKAKTEN